MHIEDLRAWHWIIIGLLAGLLFGLVRREAGPWYDDDSLLTLESGNLEMLVNGQPAPSPFNRLVRAFHRNEPVVKNLVVHPPVAGEPTGSEWVTGKMYQIVVAAKDSSNPQSALAYYEQWTPFKCRAGRPYKAFDGAPGKYVDIVAYLAAVQKKANPALRFQYAWWERPVWTVLLPTVGGLLIIGIAWPLLLMLMQGTGIARPRRVKPVRRAPAGTAASAAPADTAAGDRQLAAMNDQLEASLAASASSHAADSVAPAAASPTVKPLAPADPFCDAVAAAEAEAVKEYGGEFYPVAKPGASKPHG